VAVSLNKLSVVILDPDGFQVVRTLRVRTPCRFMSYDSQAKVFLYTVTDNLIYALHVT
jgi:hypothetical protein